ncbi:MAG: tyrosine-type recombinase/integrase [Anaerolineae bacterium]|nr:tyrosine-type recombinase/integrase [Anaerolineae bacterium]
MTELTITRPQDLTVHVLDPNAWRDTWLDARAQNPHTRRAYERAWTDFFAFAGVEPWQVTVTQAAAWRRQMEIGGKAPATIRQYMAALSSFYRFLSQTYGFPFNPFTAKATPRPTAPSRAHPLGRDQVQAMLGLINRDCLTGARDYALLITFLLTGRRSNEVLHMRWGDIYPDEYRRRGTGEYSWRIGPTEEVPLAPACYDAIVHYLRIAHRWEPPANAYIWHPISDRGCANFSNVDMRRLKYNRPISRAQAARILHRRLRDAGVPNPERYRLQDLRHTFAYFHSHTYHNVALLQERLGHSRLHTTKAYLERLPSPNHGELLSAMGIVTHPDEPSSNGNEPVKDRDGRGTTP